MIRILLVEDQEIVRRGLKTLLETKPDLAVIGEANNGQQAIDIVDEWAHHNSVPDLVLMDIRMPVMDGVKTTQILCEKYPGIRILILTTFDDSAYVAEALRFGAKGYLLKDTPSNELAEAIRSIHRGYTQFGPGILEKMIAHVPTAEAEKAPDAPPGLAELTQREKEVLRMIAAGSSNREIAQALFLSEGTVRNHISHILSRLNVRDRTQAAILANTHITLLETS
jgi:DNA-binding NarL/FixJ family response regulator